MKFNISFPLFIMFTGVGIISGITSLWFNYLSLKTSSLENLSIQYIIVGLILVIIGYLFERNKWRIKLESVKK